MRPVIAVLALLTLAACSSTTLTPTQRIADVVACEAAVAIAGIPIAQAIADQASPNAAKASAAQKAVTDANALPACLKVGANAATVIAEQRAMRKALPAQK